ncbi:MAG: EscU/YscU/HrcU family type III secretion system export apparatus switch protein [Candidatus Schekmanbacteria bacterium]|nr:EscU/YscU/HrcU family type III secretion system export apparatus switch protein [Candidatus Schekmanbacteria bacterium]
MNAPLNRKTAAALRYDPELETAPRLIARGSGAIADRIVSVALEHGIPIREDPDLAQMLQQLEVGLEIPPKLYQVVAEILAFVYRLNAGWQEQRVPPPKQR